MVSQGIAHRPLAITSIKQEDRSYRIVGEPNCASVQSRWALGYCRIDFKKTAYIPLIGEILLRWRLWKWSGPISVPVLFHAHGVGL